MKLRYARMKVWCEQSGPVKYQNVLFRQYLLKKVTDITISIVNGNAVFTNMKNIVA